MIFKFNGGVGAVLCGRCHKIIYSGKNIPKYIWDAVIEGTVNELPDVYCEDNCEASKQIIKSILNDLQEVKNNFKSSNNDENPQESE